MAEKDPDHSGTGVFYQAIPAVGADGRNIMKLIPVKMINGDLFKSQISRINTIIAPPKAITVNIASGPVGMGQKPALNPSATEQIVRKQVPLVNATPYQVGSNLGYSLNKNPLQQRQQSVNLLAIVPPMGLPVANSGKSVRPPCQLPVTVQSPVPPRIQCFQIPPQAQVRTVPASDLSAVNKKQTFTPSAKLLCRTSNTTSCGLPSQGSEPHFNLVPNVPQRPNSPIKWSVEEEDNSTVPTLNPIGYSATSEILRLLAGRENAPIRKPGPALEPIQSSVTTERENAGKLCEVLIKSVTGSNQGKSVEKLANPMFMWNGKQPQQQQNVHVMALVPLMSTPVANSGTSGRPPSDLQVTVKPQALQRGQCLQILPRTQVRTVPASHLPPGIKKQTFPPPVNSSPSSTLPGAVYMAPITSVNPGVTPQSDSALDMLKLLCKTSNAALHRPPLNGSEPHLKLIPNVPQRHDSPIKWSIEEDNETAPTPDAVDSSVTLEILRVAAVRENAEKHCNVVRNPASGSSQGKSGQGEENPSVMWNGKLFVFSKNCSPPYKTGKSDPPLASVTPRKKKGLGILNPNQSHKVIDLCDDDAPNDSSQQAPSVPRWAATPADEDNVIFVSYTPPAPESQDLRPQTTHGKETDPAATSSSSNVSEHESPDGTPGTLEGRHLDQNVSVNTVNHPTHVNVSAVVNMHDDDDDCSNVNSQQSTSAQQLESMEVDPSSNGVCVGLMEDTHSVESSMTSRTSSPAPESCQRSDDMLRRIFGITADVKIDLQRMDGASARSLPAGPPESECIKPVEDHQETSSGFKDGELFMQQETESCNGLINAERGNVLAQQEPSKDSPSPSPRAGHGPPECSHFKVNTNPSPRGTCGDVETEPMTGYVEPIDEDFLSAEEEDFPDSRDTAGRSQTCADLNANTGRQGRKRKRPTCPCCIPGAPDPPARSSEKSEEPEKWEWTTERTSKKGARAKALSKDGKTSGSVGCLTAKNMHSCRTSEDPSSDGLSTASVDCDELKLHKQISRLKELLQEKEAALELMRTGRVEALEGLDGQRQDTPSAVCISDG
ncbi:ligand-dependent nuclear receptor-interacting factor 1 [Cyclopterus lumpus]|uniref:ligand-dependent nuclear receptor-interacting factor 1 n=1 Tax=Cyclopterus lumpus TaxID=8103 RepID=UPI001486003D|nr:ligand-dependent nuclear receptor-interacting factor 1 [Cyclopterus lumpus]